MKVKKIGAAVLASLLALPLPELLRAETISYQYDVLNRLTEVRYPDGGSIFYGYDAVGNIVATVVRSEVDTDGDGLPDSSDTDDDNDGVPDALDVFPLDPSEQLDTDRDGIGNNADPDDDNDGTPNVIDSAPLDPTNTGGIIALPLNAIQSAQHGFGWGDNAYRSLLVATFTGDGTDRLLHVQGYDIDSADELALWLNGNLLGTLSRTTSNTLGTPGLWWLPAAAQVAGENRIEIRQKTAGEKWGVTGLGLYAPGAALGNLKTLAGGDRAHAAGFELHLPQTSAGYLLGLSDYDSDSDGEIGLYLNGSATALVTLPKGVNAAWGTAYQLPLPGAWLRPGDNLLLVKDKSATEEWGLRLDGLRAFGADQGLMDSLPAAQQQGDRVTLLLAPRTGATLLTYRCYDSDSATEVARTLDGKAAGTCPASGDNAWGTEQGIILSARVRHLLVLDSTLDPPGTDPWGIQLVAWLSDPDADGVPDGSDNCPSAANPDQADHRRRHPGRRLRPRRRQRRRARHPDDCLPARPHRVAGQRPRPHRQQRRTTARPPPTPTQANLDGDALGDACDPDDDNDGVLDTKDNFPRDPTEWLDNDGDGVGNNADPDDDNDGYPDLVDPYPLDARKVPTARIGVYSPAALTFLLDLDGSRSETDDDLLDGPLGQAGDLPVRGDWNGDGLDETGVYRPSEGRFYLDLDGEGVWTDTDAFGGPEDVPVSGDWDGDGQDEIGLYRPSSRQFTLDLDGSLSPTAGDVATAAFGAAGDLPVSGDWNGDRRDEIGVWAPGTRRFTLDSNASRSLNAGDRTTLAYGQPGDRPLVGDWNGDGKDEIGVYRPSQRQFYLDSDGNYLSTIRDAVSAPFGASGDVPLSGRW